MVGQTEPGRPDAYIRQEGMSRRSELQALKELDPKLREKNSGLAHLFDVLFVQQPAIRGISEEQIKELKERYMSASRIWKAFNDLLLSKVHIQQLREKGDTENAELIDGERIRTITRWIRNEDVLHVFQMTGDAYIDAVSELHVDLGEFTLQAAGQYKKMLAQQLGECMMRKQFGDTLPSVDKITETILKQIDQKREELKKLETIHKDCAEKRELKEISEDQFIRALKDVLWVRREITALEEYLEAMNGVA